MNAICTYRRRTDGWGVDVLAAYEIPAEIESNHKYTRILEGEWDTLLCDTESAAKSLTYAINMHSDNQ